MRKISAFPCNGGVTCGELTRLGPREPARSGGWPVIGNSRPPQDPPPWATVIATTVRLWVQRHVRAGRPGLSAARRGAAARRSYARAAVVSAVIVVFAAGAAGVAIATSDGSTPASGTPGD